MVELGDVSYHAACRGISELLTSENSDCFSPLWLDDHKAKNALSLRNKVKKELSQ